MTIAPPSMAFCGFCVLVLPGETCLSNMEPGKPYLAASIAGAKQDSGGRFYRNCNSKLITLGNLAERFIMLMAVSFAPINMPQEQKHQRRRTKHWATAREALAPRFTCVVKTTDDR